MALAFAVVPAAWCAHLLSVQARRRLTDSRGLAEFASRTRPVLLALFALYAGALTALALLAELVLGGGPGSGHLAPTVALGSLLLLARLLTVHGFPKAAATGLVTACAVEAVALALATAGRVPGLESAAAPVRALVDAGEPAPYRPRLRRRRARPADPRRRHPVPGLGPHLTGGPPSTGARPPFGPPVRTQRPPAEPTPRA